MDYICLTSEKIDIQHVLSSLSKPSVGATSVFVGTTRDTFEGKKVESLEYEAYESMALNKMRNICATMYSRWPLMGTVIVHRIGSVPVQEASIVIAACAANRKAAIESVAYCIDEVKATVPVWKKERYSDGTSNWKANAECKWTDHNNNDASKHVQP